MIEQERHEMILDTLRKTSPLAVSGLEKALGVSGATVRRDLRFLENLGKVVRTHGGVLHPDHARGELSFDRKSRSALKAKLALAEAAVRLVRPGDTAFVDAGSTLLELGKRLLEVTGVSIYTNSVPLLNERPVRDGRLIGIGGEVRGVSLALVGPIALEWIGRLRVDVAFLGASGIQPDEGPSTTELSEAGIKSAVAGRAKRVVVLADASKWGHPAAVRYASWDRINDLFTDYRCNRAERALLNRHGTHLHCIEK